MEEMEIAVDLIQEVDIGQYNRLMGGSLVLRGPQTSSPGLEAAGDAVTLATSREFSTSPGGQARYVVRLTQDWVSAVQVAVPTNTPFHVAFDLALGSPIGDIDAGPEFPGNGSVKSCSFQSRWERVSLGGVRRIRPGP